MDISQIRCRYAHRLFDTNDDAKLRIKMKCGSSRQCSRRERCSRCEEIFVGHCDPPLSGEYRKVICPYCKKRLLDATEDSDGVIHIKCDYCARISALHVVPK